VVPIRAHLTGAFPLFASRPRYTVRQLLKVASITDRTLAYVRETPGGRAVAGTSYGATPESTFASEVVRAELTDLRLRVEVPDGLLEQPAQLAAWVDYRVLVRLGVVENEALLHGTDDGRIPGLLNLPGIRHGSLDGDLGEVLTRAAGQVEETGGSCDGITVHPHLYWRLVHSGLLGRLAEAGVRVARTRMMPEDKALLGDYRAAVTLLDPSDSSLTLSRKTGISGRDVVDVRMRVGLATHLPQHFLLLSGGAS
jgi:Phage capsid family